MYHSDPNINIAVERQAERVRAVRAYGSAQMPAAAWPTDNSARGARPAVHTRLALSAAVLLAGTLVAVLASTGGFASLMAYLVR